ncbi:hypothetical protein, partial [Vibrio vulnificus]|uniref:hypothetical protein n=1 Tax=Vibrio vulnificus TaxID=672 RepID=UPI0019D41869
PKFNFLQISVISLQGLIMEMHDKEVVLEVSEAKSRTINYLYVQDDGQGLGLEEPSLESMI